jgi:hypothetical protein
MERREAIAVCMVHIRARSQQRVNCGCAIIHGSEHERRVAIPVGAIHACARR